MSAEPRDVDVDELRALMGATGMLPEVPTRLTHDTSARESLLQRILAEAAAGDAPAAEPATPLAPVTPLAPARHRRAQSRRRVLTLAVAGAVALVAVLGTQLTSGPQALAGSPAALSFSRAQVLDVVDGTAPSAHDSLTELAATAASAPVELADGDVQRVATYAWLLVQDGDTGQVSTVPTQSLWWVAPDGAIRSTQIRTGAITPDGQIDPTAVPQAAPPVSTDEFPAGSLVPATLAELPRDPAALTVELEILAGGEMCTVDPATQATCLITAVQQLFSQYVVPGDLAAAMWSALAEQTAVTDLGSTTDRFGRDGVAVAVAPSSGSPAAVTVLIISPTDGQLLGVESIAVSDPQGPIAPSVTGFTAWNPSSWVPTIGD